MGVGFTNLIRKTVETQRHYNSSLGMQPSLLQSTQGSNLPIG
jgi:hypothetical protein